jgi:gliding motility-associated protein GldC
MKQSTIKIDIELNDDKHPQKITWESNDNPSGDKKTEVKAMLLSLFDKDYKDTYKIDLWTSELQVVEMDRFMFQTLKALGDTYFKATQNAELASAIQSLADYIGKETGIIPKEEQ